MSKISPMQAAALGLETIVNKPTVIKTNSIKPNVINQAVISAATTVAAPESVAAAKVTPKVAAKKLVAKPASVKPATTKTAAKSNPRPALKPTAKSASQAKADHGKKNKKIDKHDDKKAKPEKVKMERDSFTMPKDEYAQLTLLKARLTSMGQPAKKSELLRAGIKLLAAMSDNTLKTTLAKIPVIKTGRPNKKA